MAYTREQLRKIFQNKFDREAWKAIVVDIFGANKVRRENELLTTSDEPETGYYMGSIDTPDAFRIGLFYYKINTGSVAHKKVGLRNLVKRFINQNWGEFDAAIVVFDDSQDWRLSFVCDIKEEATAPKRFTYVFGETDNLYRTAIERFTILQSQKPTFENMRKAFSVDALSDDFFDEYRNLYATFVEYITGKRYVKERNKWVERKVNDPDYQYETTFGSDDRLVRDYIKKLFGRIVFLYFLQRKGWLDGNRQYMHDLFFYSPKKNDFLDGVLEPLFFEVLNTDKPYRTEASKELPGSENIPYLNGGLFARDETDALNCVFPEILFKQLFDFLDSYNFTIDENDPEDAEIGIDPEMLGRIFENLLEDNKDKGAFYTPKEIVAYMCRESIIAYLLNGIPARSHDLIRTFVDTLDSSQLNDEQRHFIKNKLSEVKICDPAIGSGAFPMGMVNLLSKLYTALGLVSDHANMKRYIMERSIYGVDIEKGAVDIARLRFWLAMVVDAEKPEPLPNLHFKIMQGNSLLESYQGFDLQAISNTSDTNNTVWNAEAAVMLRKDIDAFYNTSDHSIRDRRLYQICNSVKTQLINLGIKEEDLAGVDPSATDRFFLWHTWFAPIFQKGGFDIVIGNPPYIDSETMTSKMPALREVYKRLYDTAKGNWDIFIPFIELGINLLKPNGVISYIVPNKLIAAKYAAVARHNIQSYNLHILRDYGQVPVFEASVYPCVFLITRNAQSKLPLFEQMYSLTEATSSYNIPKEIYLNDCFWDKYFMSGDKLDIIKKMTLNTSPLSTYDIVKILGAATVAEAYAIKEIVREDDEKTDGFKLINTGTIDKFTPLWGVKTTQYIKGQYIRPMVLEQDLYNINPKRATQSQSDKIIVAGMSSTIEAIYDEGEVLAGKSTSIILGDKDTLKPLTCLINSRLLSFWLNINFNSLKMAGGYINVGTNEIGALPVPPVNTLIKAFEPILKEYPSQNLWLDNINQIDLIVYHLYGLTYDEVLVVDPATPITREEYESRNVKKSIDS